MIASTLNTGYLAAFIVGLLGGVHCVGMCGGIVGALGLGLPEGVRGRTRAMLPYLLAYNAGRITSYTLAGALFGGIGWLAAHTLAVHAAQQVLAVIAGTFMLALGLYLGGLWRGVVYLERAGTHVWRRLEPLGRRFLPVQRPGQAFMLGLVWGWLPCGLVYSVLIWALSAGGTLKGALLMLSFGLGTLPNLVAMGVFAATLAALVRRPWVRRVAGVLVSSFGVWMIIRSLS